MSPQSFQIIKFAGLVVKNMNNDIHIIDKHPAGIFFALHMAAVYFFDSQTRRHVVGNSAHVPVGISGSDDKIAGDGIQPPKIED